MISFDLRNLHTLPSAHGLSGEELENASSKILSFLKNIEQHDQGFYKVIDEEETLKEIESFVKQVEGKFDDIMILGIGGSALGTYCLLETLGSNGPLIHVLDNIDPAFIADEEAQLDLKRTLFLVISKKPRFIRVPKSFPKIPSCSS